MILNGKTEVSKPHIISRSIYERSQRDMRQCKPSQNKVSDGCDLVALAEKVNAKCQENQDKGREEGYYNPGWIHAVPTVTIMEANAVPGYAIQNSV